MLRLVPLDLSNNGKLLTILRHMAYVRSLPDKDVLFIELDPVNGLPVSFVPKTYDHKSSCCVPLVNVHPNCFATENNNSFGIPNFGFSSRLWIRCI